MRFALLGSGSRGNATVVCTGESALLIDCGFSAAEAKRRLQALDLAPTRLKAILVTHEHSDHVGGVAVLARQLKVPVYGSAGTLMASGLYAREGVTTHAFDSHEAFCVAEIGIEPVIVPHDAKEPTQFLLEYRGKRLGVLTDLGHISSHVAQAYRDLDALLLECNHDPELLARGPYPPMLKQRVGGYWGHLSNAQAVELLVQLDAERLQHLVLSHISEKNNTQDHVWTQVGQRFPYRDRVYLAAQDQPSGWFEIND